MKSLAQRVLRRYALEFPSQEAYKKYLYEHPKANPKNHSVKEAPKGEPKGEEPAAAPAKETSTSLGSPKAVEAMLTKHKAGLDKASKSMKSALSEFESRNTMHPDSLQAKTFKEMSEPEKLLHTGGYKIGEYFEKSVLTNKALHKKYMSAWQEDSDSPEAVELQGALESLGIKGSRSPGDDKRKDQVDEWRKKGAQNEELKQYVQEVYDFTQAALKHLGVENLKVFRGIDGQGLNTEPPNDGDEVEFTTREISSYSTDSGEAFSFGRVIQIDVPADKVFASVLTRPNFTPPAVKDGAMGQGEVLLAGTSGLKGKIIAFPSWLKNKKTAAEEAPKKKPLVVHLNNSNETWLNKSRKQSKKVVKAYLQSLLVLLVGLLAFPARAQEAQECNGTCVPAGDMSKIVTVLKERKCFDETKPEFTLDPVNIIVDRDGRIYHSGADPKPYKLHMRWCNYEAEGTGKVNVLAAVQEPPSYGFRFRPKAFVGMLVLEPFREGKKPKDGLDAGLMVDAFYIKDFNLNVHAGFRSIGAGIGVDIFRSFGAYAGYALAWDGFHHNPEASLWFAFW